MRPAVLLLLTLTATSAAAQDRSSPLPSHLPLGKEACFSYSFDRDQLRAKPRQRVTAITLFRDLTPDDLSEEEPRSGAEIREADGNSGSIAITAMVTMRGQPQPYANTLFCSRDLKGGVRCGVECDGGSFKLRPDKDALIIENDGFILQGGCGDPEQKIFLDPKPDDRVFRIEPKPVEFCQQLRDLRRPAYTTTGTPLRVRLSTEQPVCFSREYDAKHLARHPQQTVKRIAVLKAAGKPDSVQELTFRVELKNGRKLAKKTTCYASRYAYACTHNPDFDTAQDFFLTRDGGDAIMLRDAKGKLVELFGTKLGSDDRTFRLSASPVAACDF
jgi:hypothetical protein